MIESTQKRGLSIFFVHANSAENANRANIANIAKTYHPGFA